MDFFQITTKETRGGVTEIYPDFIVGRSKDLMVRGRAFYAIWDNEKGLWSRDEYDVQRLVDLELRMYANEADIPGNVKYMRSFNTNGWNQFRKFMSQISDNSHSLDETLTFANTEVKKSDYVSRRLPYNLSSRTTFRTVSMMSPGTSKRPVTTFQPIHNTGVDHEFNHLPPVQVGQIL